jgi:hypothetical protein
MLVESKTSTAEPNGVVRLKSDGAVEPVGAHVENMDNVTYRLASNMTDSVIVEKNDIVLDGSGFSIEGSRDRDGIFMGGKKKCGNQERENRKLLFWHPHFQLFKHICFGMHFGQQPVGAQTGILPEQLCMWERCGS